MSGHLELWIWRVDAAVIVKGFPLATVKLRWPYGPVIVELILLAQPIQGSFFYDPFAFGDAVGRELNAVGRELVAVIIGV